MSQEGQAVELQQIANENPGLEPELSSEKTETNETTEGLGSPVEGTSNPGFTQADEPLEEIPPPMTFVDFLPLLIEPASSNADPPVYAEFRFGFIFDSFP